MPWLFRRLLCLAGLQMMRRGICHNCIVSLLKRNAGFGMCSGGWRRSCIGGAVRLWPIWLLARGCSSARALLSRWTPSGFLS